MSLILDALRKLDRDKSARDPHVVLVGSVPWEGVRHHRPAAWILPLALAAAAGVGVTAWWLTRRPVASPPPSAPTLGTRGDDSLGAARLEPEPSRGGTVGDTAADPPWPHTAAPLPPARRLVVPGEPRPGTREAAPPREREAPPPADELQLNAISERDGHPVALINNRLVREGDSVDGVRILRIGESEVEVEVRGRRRTLRF